VVFFSSRVTNVRLPDLTPHTKNGSNDLLQEVKPEQLKSTSDSKMLGRRSRCCARITDKLRDAYTKNAEALGYDPYLGSFFFLSVVKR